MTTRYRLKLLSAENCVLEIYSKMQEFVFFFFQLKTHRLSTLFHQKTKKQKNKHKQKTKKHGLRNNRKKNFYFLHL